VMFIEESMAAIDWKAWMGSISKNSWATMKGDLSIFRSAKRD
jgi:hypothetical protein